MISKGRAMTDDELLKRAAEDYFRYAQSETDGYS